MEYPLEETEALSSQHYCGFSGALRRTLPDCARLSLGHWETMWPSVKQ